MMSKVKVLHRWQGTMRQKFEDVKKKKKNQEPIDFFFWQSCAKF